MTRRSKILIVDDKVENLIALEKILTVFDVDIIRARGGNEALQHTLNHDFALALVDVQMPEMDGYEMVTYLRSNKETRYLPVIFVSAIYNEDFHIIKGIESGAVDFITKPINPVILRGKVRVFLDLNEQKARLQEEVKKRTLAEEILNRQNSLLTTLLQSIPDQVFYKDVQQRFTGCNQAFADFIGQKAGDLPGKTESEVRSGEWLTSAEHADQHILQSGKPSRTEHWETGRDGKRYLLETLRSPILSESGETIGIIGISRDVTEKHNDKMELQKAKDSAEAANMAKSMFLANMSHEIRTPMNGIIGMTDILKQTQLNAEQKDYLNIISLSGNNLLTIINDILDFSKIESGGVELEKIDFRLTDPFNETLRLLSFKAEQNGLYLRLDLAPDLPPVVKGDPLRTKQILINLVNNALKFTKEGGVTICAEIQEESKRKVDILIKVVDTGIGISEEGKQKLFKAFSQTDASMSRKYGGTGLGLTISKRLVELMNGEIGVESELGKGSTFWFSLSFIKASPAETKENNQQKKKKDQTGALRILLVEDNPINQKVAMFHLNKLGHQVQTAENGQEAINWFEREDWDIILMDIQMPVMDGLEATIQIRAFEKKMRRQFPVPIIAMTANAMKGDREKYISQGMSGYISKPFKIKELEELLQFTVKK